MPTPSAILRGSRHPVHPHRAALTAALGCLLVGAMGGCQVPPDVLALPGYIRDYFTNPNFIVNAPTLHELLGTANGAPDRETREQRLQLPPGFVLDVYAEDIPHPRFLRVTPAGDLLVTQPRKQKVLFLGRDANGDGRADETRVLLDGLHLPHGVELVDGMLYIAEPESILRVGFDIASGRVLGEPEVFAPLVDTTSHINRPLRVGPDGWLYTAIGANCNHCLPASDREAAILRFDLETGREEIFASGFRNAASFDWQPRSGRMFATDVGVDFLGDDDPREEVNEISRGAFYGFPYLHANVEFTPETDANASVAAAEAARRVASARGPALTFTAHSTPLGISFLHSPHLPEAYRGAALVALHGSWNRRRKSGYALVSLHWREDRAIEVRDFLIGFERDEDVIGRPVDIVEAPNGDLFLSDDYAGAIYRIRYDPARAEAHALRAPTRSAQATHLEPPSDRVDPLLSVSEEDRLRLSTLGAELYERHACAECHGVGEDTTAAPDLAKLAQRYSLRGLVELLDSPPAAMPRLVLEDEERRALAVHLLEERGP